MQKVGFSILVLLIGSCSSNYYQRPESISSKMERYKSKNGNENIVPQFEVKEIQISQNINHSSRTPASANKQDALPKNNRKFYFLTLLGQYKNLSTYVGKDYTLPEINYCPHFHSSLVDYNESAKFPKKNSRLLTQEGQLNWTTLKTLKVTQYPELALPITDTNKEPRVIDILNNQEEVKKYKTPKKLIQHAMAIHLNKTYKELNTLCEYGNSANYYHYENLLGHIERKSSQFKANTESIKILLKSTLYSNMTLLNSLESTNFNQGRIPASATSSIHRDPYHRELLNRFRAPWASNYLKEIK